MHIAILPILFGITLILYYKCKKSIDLGFYTLFILTLFSSMSLMFYLHPFFPFTIHAGYRAGIGYSESYYASLYLYTCYIVWLIPLLKLKQNYSEIIVNNKKVRELFIIFIVFSFVFSLLVLPKAFSGINASDLATHKNEIQQHGIRYASGVMSVFVLFYGRFSDAIVFLFFYSLTLKKEKLLIKNCLGVASILPVILQTFATSHRFSIVFLLINMFTAFVLFKDLYSRKTLRYIKIFIIITLLFTCFIVVDFSAKRFSHSGHASGNFFVLKYAGEGMVNFNTLLFNNLEEKFEGNLTIPVVRKLLGLEHTKGDQERKIKYSNVNFPNYLFYTFVGGFVADFGLFATLVIFCMICATMLRKIKQAYKQQIHLCDIFLIYILTIILLKGIFYYHYKDYEGNMKIISLFLFYAYLRYRLIVDYNFFNFSFKKLTLK